MGSKNEYNPENHKRQAWNPSGVREEQTLSANFAARKNATTPLALDSVLDDAQFPDEAERMELSSQIEKSAVSIEQIVSTENALTT